MDNEKFSFNEEDNIDIRSYTPDSKMEKEEPEKPVKKTTKKPVKKQVKKTAPKKTETKPTNTVSKIATTYTDGAFKNLGNIIKFIAFFIAIILLLASIGVGALLYITKILPAVIAVGIALLGTIFAIICFFPLYGIGQIVCQNKEILRRLEK